jgi:hypothetical protein|tara:strand:- start:55 stop:498 length:444 start_codon:yes stop_codon:yes gene_type:complete
MSRIVSFRGKIPSGGIDTIPLQTNNGLIGYKMRSLRVVGSDPVVNEDEGVIKVYSVPQTTATSTVDFSDQTLLAVGIWTSRATTRSYPVNENIYFDNTTFNQDIYVSSVESVSGNALNYYIELEQMKLDLSQQTVATLKDIRNVGAE